jgi:sulfur carrier protein ThiS
MDTGESITVAHIVKQGGTAYYNSAVQIDGSVLHQNGKVELHQQVVILTH